MAFKILVNSLFGGGAEIQAALLARALKPETFFLLDAGVAARPGMPEFSSLSRRGSSLPGTIKTLLTPLYANRLAALTGRGDTVLSLMERSNFVNILAARRSGHRAVICERTQPSVDFSGIRGFLMKPIIRKLYPEAAMIISNSRGNALDLAANFGVPREKIRVVTNACDTEAVRAAAAEPLESRHEAVFSRPVIITSGRLRTQKGHWHLLRIFAELKKNGTDAALVILGEGELHKELLGLCAKLGLETYSSGGAFPPQGKGDVFFLGFQKNPYKFFARARLFALTSLWEGLPNVVIEALACGLPVISSDCRSGPREILAPETDFMTEAAAPEETTAGLLMPQFQVAAPDLTPVISGLEQIWAKNISCLLADKARLETLGAAGRRRADDFSIKTKIEEWQIVLGLKAPESCG